MSACPVCGTDRPGPADYPGRCPNHDDAEHQRVRAAHAAGRIARCVYCKGEHDPGACPDERGQR